MGKCAYRSEPYGPIKCGVYFPELGDYQFLVKDSILRSNVGCVSGRG